MRPKSIYARLLALALAVVALGGGLAALGSYRKALHEADELFDAQLAQTAQTLLVLVAHADDDIAREVKRGHRYQQKLLFQVWHEDDGEQRLLLRSANAPRQPLPGLEHHGFGDGDWEGRRWRFYSVADAEHETHVIVGEDIAVRQELARKVAWNGLLPFLVALPVLGLLLYFAVRQGLKPLRALAAELGRRRPERLEAVALADPPAELAPVLAALNGLLEQVAAALDNERRFTADAAHELRTPLAALQAQIQVAGLTPDAAERRAALEKCLQGTARMSHLVEQLLTLARLEAEAGEIGREPADLAAIAASVCAELGPAALAKRIALELEAPQTVPLDGRPHLLAVLARNLADNAIRYTPEGGRVRVAVSDAAAQAVLRVQDSGLGVPAEKLELLGRRFHRFDEAGPEGVGLGLSIVRRIAALHGGRVEFAQACPAGGLAVTVTLPK